jgi:hypothetical protein
VGSNEEEKSNIIGFCKIKFIPVVDSKEEGWSIVKA